MIRQGSSLPPPSSAHWLKAFVAVVCLAIVMLEGWRDWSERRNEIARNETSMANLARSLVQHADDTFELADAVLVDIVDRVETSGITPVASDRTHRFLSERIKTLPHLKALAVYDTHGRTAATSSGHTPPDSSIAGHVFFQHHSRSADDDWFFGPLIRDPADGRWVLTLSRRLDKPEGEFGGVAVVSIDPGYFSDFHSRFNVGSEGSIALFTIDGTLVSRYPHIENATGKSGASDPLFTSYLPRASAGSYTYKSSIDGVDRLSGYQRSEKFPVVTLAAVGLVESLERWDRDFSFRAFGVLLLVSTIGSLGWSLVAQLRRREKAEAELAELAATDGLTGLANRRVFDRELAAEFQRASRSGMPLSLLLIDVDRFKSFNDAYGHQAGDECLQTLSEVIVQAVRRPSDLVARYGGEELVVLLPGTDEAGAVDVAETIRARVEALAMRHEANAPSRVLTISIGSATFMPGIPEVYAEPKVLVAMADRALYQAKVEGRNRIAVCEAA
ncbi:sensor domain-containing diguanylate cyclase [Microvirga alba]|uniref:diguanylate cyclase n=1 Tax=Microvirga alba TaxID=2791025 RepID=A0A931BNA9_9HYPH|nr:sensor domain-containing diguanylate cyclase [Microvirga alba]MBF9231764.1 sensor domain-containing diguanylate cyclase [Microvirga alba]